MPSPFPGMNPFLEQETVFHDFHQTVIPLIRGALVEQVRPGYLIKLEEYLFIHELPAEQRRVLGVADVAVSRGTRPTTETSPSSSGSAGAIVAPVRRRLQLATETERHSYLEIRDRGNLQLVTVIELLSPSNKKPGVDRDQYLAKREELFRGGVHLVEIDLLRGWPRMPVEDLPDCDYCVLVSRAEDRPEVDVWPIKLRERLPIIPIPLRAPREPASLDLQAVLQQAYALTNYEDYIYDGTPTPPLSEQDASWAKQFVATRRQE